jgi:hypothetical protein
MIEKSTLFSGDVKMLFEPELLLDDAENDLSSSGEDETSADIESIEGIAFTIAEGFSKRDCFIQKHALYKLSGSLSPQDLRYVFNKNEHRIHQVARRVAGDFPRGSTIVVTAADVRRFGEH